MSHGSHDNRINRIARVMKVLHERLTQDLGDDNDRWFEITLAYQDVFAQTDVHHDASGLTAQLDRIESKIGRVIKLEVQVAGTIDDILTEINELPSINDSMDALFDRLAALISANDPAKTAQAIELLVAQKSRTKASIVAHTPAEGEVPPFDPPIGRQS